MFSLSEFLCVAIKGGNVIAPFLLCSPYKVNLSFEYFNCLSFKTSKTVLL